MPSPCPTPSSSSAARPAIRTGSTDAVKETDSLIPDHLTLDSYLKLKGWDSRPLD